MSLRTLNPLLLRLYRAGVLAVIAWLIYDQHQWVKAQTEGMLSVERIKDFFPEAVSLGARDPASGVQRVFDAAEETIGMVTQTAPLSDKIIGYSGPTNTLIACDPQGKTIGLRVLHSADTPEHLAEVLRHRKFFDDFKGFKLGDTNATSKVDAVSGATLTSTAIAEGVLKRLGQKGTSLRFPQEITLEEVKMLVPDAASFRPKQDETGMFEIFNASDVCIAQACRTSPSSDAVIGYKGPTDTLIIFDASGKKIVTIHLRKSYDTEDYVGYVTGDSYFMNLFNGMEIGKLATLDFAQAKIEGVSGATDTSWSVAEGLKRRAQALGESRAPIKRWFEKITFKLSDGLLLMVFLFSTVMTFTSLRGYRWLRWFHHALLIGYAGWYSGAMLSQALLVGWARYGVPWQTSPMLTLLTALALTIPLFTRRQFYCHHYCPHGALQQVLAHQLKWQLHIPPRLGKWLEKIPLFLLVLILVATMLTWNVNLNAWEPFDAWLIRVAGWGTITVAVIGLTASLFVPMSYCRYGCPTGALLKFMRYTGQGDTLGKRDAAAFGLVTLAVVMRYVAKM